jgi:hypothetical protein
MALLLNNGKFFSLHERRKEGNREMETRKGRGKRNKVIGKRKFNTVIFKTALF